MSEGVLVIVGTPIGNMSDLTPRAADALQDADVILCEDSRRARKLLQLVGVSSKPFIVVNQHTEQLRIESVLEKLEGGARLVLVSDAGMPGISDPGSLLVSRVAGAGYAVQVCPGVCAVSTALAISGCSADKYIFEGFLDRKGASRSLSLSAIANNVYTTVLYEAPHRLLRTLRDLSAVCATDRTLVVCRELTKLYEEVFRGSIQDAIDFYSEKKVRGEFVLVLEGVSPVDGEEQYSEEKIRELLEDRKHAGVSTRDAIREVVSVTGVAKNLVYDLAVKIDTE